MREKTHSCTVRTRTSFVVKIPHRRQGDLFFKLPCTTTLQVFSSEPSAPSRVELTLGYIYVYPIYVIRSLTLHCGTRFKDTELTIFEKVND